MMNRVIMIYATSNKDFDNFVADVNGIVPYIHSELDKLKQNGQGFSSKAVAYRNFLYSQANWREDRPEDKPKHDQDKCSQCGAEIRFNGVAWVHLSRVTPRHPALPSLTSIIKTG